MGEPHRAHRPDILLYPIIQPFSFFVYHNGVDILLLLCSIVYEVVFRTSRYFRQGYLLYIFDLFSGRQSD